MKSPYIIRHTLVKLSKSIEIQIKTIEKINNVHTKKSIISQENYKLEKMVKQYETIEKAMRISYYTEAPIQK